jgi:hypothetical protein
LKSEIKKKHVEEILRKMKEKEIERKKTNKE